MELFGRGYVIDHCIAFFKNRQEERLYKAYVTDVLRTLAELTGNIGGAKVSAQDFKEIAGYIKADERTGDDIAEEIIKRAGLRTKDEYI